MRLTSDSAFVSISASSPVKRQKYVCTLPLSCATSAAASSEVYKTVERFGMARDLSNPTRYQEEAKERPVAEAVPPAAALAPALATPVPLTRPSNRSQARVRRARSLTRARARGPAQRVLPERARARHAESTPAAPTARGLAPPVWHAPPAPARLGQRRVRKPDAF